MNNTANGSLPNRDFIRVGASKIQGTGVFAKRKIPRGTRVIEYVGERITLESLLADDAGAAKPRRYIFCLNESSAIDGEYKGNESRFINHSCQPNCEAYVFEDHVYIYAMQDIKRGDELTFDYKLAAPKSGMKKYTNLNDYVCHCGAANCRGTMLSKLHRPRNKKE